MAPRTRLISTPSLIAFILTCFFLDPSSLFHQVVFFIRPGIAAATEAVQGTPKPLNVTDSPEMTSSRAGEKISNRVTLMAVGDIMMHLSNIRLGFRSETGGYDFLPYFKYVAPVFRKSDWVLGNLETRLAGKSARYTGYPLFNAPAQLAYDLKKAGFTLVSTANNHCLDRGEKGIIRTNENLDRAGLRQTGTFVSPEDHDTIRILRKNGISLAVLAYTYGTNGLPVPPQKSWMVNRIDFDRIGEDIGRARGPTGGFYRRHASFRLGIPPPTEPVAERRCSSSFEHGHGHRHRKSPSCGATLSDHATEQPK